MYQYSYAENQEDDGAEARRRERMAFDYVIDRLKTAEERGAFSPEAAEALFRVHQLWNFLIADLASPENGLPETLRASLISIGLWVIKETERIQRRESEDFAGLIEINRLIRDGLQ